MAKADVEANVNGEDEDGRPFRVSGHFQGGISTPLFGERKEQ
jgi:hypothetical protein